MIIIHDIFVCKPGNASKAAKMFKESMGKHPNVLHIMTDVAGQYHRVIMVSQYESLAQFEEGMKAMQNPTPEMKKEMERMKDFQDMYLTGSRDIYRTW
ncbi:MAG: hypothetical protein KGJ13_04470 [Patescibacteria group bacterium]|nr:hypothetical protein [Patescibacteria group bacterium]